MKPLPRIKKGTWKGFATLSSLTSPLFEASNQGSEIAVIARLGAGRRCAGIDGKRSVIVEKLHHKFLY
jgi:hypothetical protein